MSRIIGEPNFARPASFLFEEIRSQFPLAEQLWVRQTVDRHLELARQLVERFPAPRRECNAFTRAGVPCRRETIADGEYCPSHRHLELVEDRGATSA